MTENRYAVVFDFDGTMTIKGPSLWAALDRCAVSPDCLAELDRMRQRYLAGALAGRLTAAEELEWLEETLKTYIRDGLDLERCRAAMTQVPLRPGVIDCLKQLRHHGIRAAIISYGLTQLIAFVLEARGGGGLVDAIHSSRMIVEPSTGRFVGYDRDSLIIPANKGLWSRQFAAEHGVPLDRLLAVGDSGGDRFLGHLKGNRLGLAKDAREEATLKPHFGKVIVTDTFEPVLDWLKLKTGLK